MYFYNGNARLSYPKSVYRLVYRLSMFKRLRYIQNSASSTFLWSLVTSIKFAVAISGTEKDLYDSNVEYKKLNCAEARKKAPPAPSPPPISLPYTDTRIGWHLAYRDALMEAYKKQCPNPCYPPCPCQPGQQYYYPYGPVVHHVPAPAPVPAPIPAPVPAPVYYPYQAHAATYMVNEAIASYYNCSSNV